MPTVNRRTNNEEPEGGNSHAQAVPRVGRIPRNDPRIELLGYEQDNENILTELSLAALAVVIFALAVMAMGIIQIEIIIYTALGLALYGNPEETEHGQAEQREIEDADDSLPPDPNSSPAHLNDATALPANNNACQAPNRAI